MTALKSTQWVPVRGPSGFTNIVRVPTSSQGLVSPGDVEGEIEVWYYRSDRIPKGVPFHELEYRFYTKEGYGTGVFQKDARELLALQKATRLLRPGT